MTTKHIPVSRKRKTSSKALAHRQKAKHVTKWTIITLSILTMTASIFWAVGNTFIVFILIRWKH
jgi:hypothetical protein